MPQSGIRCAPLLLLLFLFQLSESASAQLLQEIEKEFESMATAAVRSCVKVDVVQKKDVEDLELGADGARVKRLMIARSTSLSGFLLDNSGHVVTLGDTLDGAVRVRVTLFNKGKTRVFKADVVGFNLDYNVGLLRIRGDVDIEAPPLGDSDSIRQGALVMGAGYTYNLGPSPSCSLGTVCAVDRSFKKFHAHGDCVENLLQVSFSIHNGETGGPLINTSQQVVGLILTSYMPYCSGSPGGGGGRFFSGMGQEGVTVALPINRVKEEVDSILAKQDENGSVSEGENGQPWIGLTAMDFQGKALREQLKIPEGGVLVSSIYEGDPADLAGIKENDVMTVYNSVSIEGIDHLKELISGSKAGDRVALVLIRKGKEVHVEVLLGKH